MKPDNLPPQNANPFSPLLTAAHVHRMIARAQAVAQAHTAAGEWRLALAAQQLANRLRDEFLPARADPDTLPPAA